MKHAPFSPRGHCTAPSPELQWDLWQGLQGRLAALEFPCSALELHCWLRTSRTSQAGLETHMPLTRAAPANGRNCPPVDQPGRKRAKVGAALLWLLVCQGRLQSCLRASLCRHNKGSSLPFSPSPAMELYSV